MVRKRGRRAMAVSGSAWSLAWLGCVYSAHADDLQQKLAICLSGKIIARSANMVQTWGSGNHRVDCESAGVDGKSSAKSRTLPFTPPDPVQEPNSAPPGTYLFTTPLAFSEITKNDGNAAFSLSNDRHTIILVLSCDSEDVVFGAGAWMEGSISSKLEYRTSLDERRRFAAACYAEAK